jgi:hypothetical protein
MNAEHARAMSDDANRAKYSKDLNNIATAIMERAKDGCYSVTVPPTDGYSFFVQGYLRAMGYKVTMYQGRYEIDW